MDVSGIVRQRLDELGLEQKDLAAAAKVTESYISQLLTRKKSPPASSRTDVYKMEGLAEALHATRDSQRNPPPPGVTSC